MKKAAHYRLAGLGLTAIAMSTIAAAEPFADVQTVIIPVAAADMNNGPAFARLVARLQSAAHRVCEAEFRSGSSYIFTRACYFGAFQDACAQLKGLRAKHFATLSAAAIVVAAR